MIRRNPSRRPAGAGPLKPVLGVIASIVLLFACHASAQQAERYVLSAGARGETVFWVLPNQFGIVPVDAQAFDAVAEGVAGIGNDIIKKNKDQQIIIARTISPKHAYAAILDEASVLKARVGAKVRWAGPIIVTGETPPGDTADIHDN